MRYTRLQPIVFLFASLFVYTLSGQPSFQKAFSADNAWIEASDIIATAGGYILAGAADLAISGPSNRPFLMKMSPEGELLWLRYFGIAYQTGFIRVIEANGGGFLAMGTSHGFTSQENGQILLVKTDADGILEWQQIIPSYISGRRNSGDWICPVSDGYIVSGRSSQGDTHAVLTRIDNQGNTVWSKRYFAGWGERPLINTAYVVGDTIFTSGSRDTHGVYSLFSAATGNPISNLLFDYPDAEESTLPYMVPASNGDWVLAGEFLPPATKLKQWVCRISRTGQMRWAKSYSNAGFGPVVALSDGNFLLIPHRRESQNANLDPTLVKIDGDGKVLWSHEYALAGPDVLNAAIETPDGGILGVGSVVLPGQSNASILVVRTNPEGLVTTCCEQPVQVTATIVDVNLFPADLEQTAFDTTWNLNLSWEPGILTDSAYCPSLSRYVELHLCAGNSIVIDGVAYSGPGLVTSTVGGPTCDTVITYNLLYTTPTGPTAVILQCPANISVDVPFGTPSVTVNYPTPAVQSDCPCPGIDLQQTSGPAGAFPPGDHTLCFQAEDNCGNQANCCFQISVREEDAAPCDVKTNGCLNVELLRITADARGRRSYHIRVRNNCAREMKYAAFELPSGVTAYAPSQGDTYLSPGGRAYDVRNPNHAPIHSIRFKTQNAGIKNGESDIFSYTLPPSSAPDYINALTVLDDQAPVEIYLNTFNCPVEKSSVFQAPVENRDDDGTGGLSPSTLQVFPNPAKTELIAVVNGWAAPVVLLRLFNAQGQRLLTQEAVTGQVKIPLENWPAGIYFIEAASPDGAQRQLRRFVVR